MRKQVAQPGYVATSTKQAKLIEEGLAIPKYHWRPDPEDARDHLFQATLGASALPAKVDLRQYASPIEDQGRLGSCTGNAIAGAIELIARMNKKTIDVSRLFIYYQERLLEGTISYDSGAYIRDGIKACYTYGAPLETLWPYNISKFAVRPAAQAYTDALRRKVTGYAKCLNFTGVKTAIASKTPVIIGFYVYSSFDTAAVARTGIMPYPDVNREQLLGGHAVCIVGYDDNLYGGSFIVRNSWGTGWGDKGYFYMPYRVIQNPNMSADFWTIKSVVTP